MATETTQAKSAMKNDKDSPTIEVNEETSDESKATAAKESAKPVAAKEAQKSATKDDAKPAAAPAVAKDEPKPAAKEAAKSAAKDEPKPAAAPTVAKDEPKPAAKEAAKPAAKDEPKPAAAPAVAKDEPKPAPAPAKDEPKPAAAPAVAKDEPKPAPAPAKEAPKAAPEPPKAATPRPPPQVDTVSRVGRAEAIVRRNVLWSLGAGVVPFPVFDALAIAGLQLKMLAELSELYSVKFTESIAKKFIGSLVSSIGGVALGTAVGASLVKLVPGAGTALGIVSVPLIGAAATHATGKVFIMHFEAGGTLLDFDPHKMRSHFRQEFEKAKQTVSEMHKNEQAKTNKTN